MSDVNRGRGNCSVCGRRMDLKRDGTVRHHGGEVLDSWPYGRTYCCKGVGRPPRSTGGDE